jgi:hypothetical protein
VYAQAHLRLGVAVVGMADYRQALLAFADGLTKDAKHAQLIAHLVDTAKQCPFAGTFVHSWMYI